MNLPSIFKAATAAALLFSSASAHAAIVNIVNNDPLFISGSPGNNFQTTSFSWGSGAATSGASVELNDVTGLLDLAAGQAARFSVGHSASGLFNGSFSIGDPLVGISAGEIVTRTSITFADFGNSPETSIDFRLRYADGSAVRSLSDIDAGVTFNQTTTGQLADLGGGVFRLISDGKGSGINAVFSSTTNLLGALEFFNYTSGMDAGADWVAIRASREVEVAPIPLPAAAWLLIGGIGALVTVTRRKG